MAKNKVELTGVNTNDIKVLSSSETEILFNTLKDGNELEKKDAKEKLINGNLKLVLSILKKYSNRCDNLDDLFQIGVIGLIKAIDNFNVDLGLKLSTYAIPMISGEIRRYLRDNQMLRVSRSVKDLAYKAIALRDELTNILGYVPSYEIVAEKLGVPIVDVLTSIEAIEDPISIFEPIYNDGGDTIYLYEQLEDKKNESDLETKLALLSSIKQLTSREQNILDKRYIIGKTQMEIASELGISQAQVSRLEKNAIKTLRKTLK
ncbi:MAG: sigma-70 family RNA polymerase sigma factor [Bacilli bacterium]|nr:sigma-70 family RNA polymerase sigma factor [Bacilli bacterium]